MATRSASTLRRQVTRRATLRLGAGAIALHAGLAWPSSAASGPAPPHEVAIELPAARLRGQATMRFLGLEIYEARLWTAPDFSPAQHASHPLALELRYARSLAGAAIAERSIAEMRRVAAVDDAQAQSWLTLLSRALPDVEPGDRLTGVRLAGGATRFFSNGRPTAAIEDPAFGRVFFDIWLSPRTSEPGLRRELIGRLP